MKSNEPTKTKKAMKTIKFLSMAALALVGAVMTGCSSDDDNIIETPQQPENTSKVVTLTTTVGLDGGGSTTRALTPGGVKTFAEGDVMAALYYKGGTLKKAESKPLASTDITEEGKKATFTFELDTPNKSNPVMYIYPAAMANNDGSTKLDALASQDGTLESLASNFDLAVYTGNWVDDNLPTGTLVNQLAVCALTLKNSDGSSPITSGLTQVTVSDGTNTYTVAPTSGTFGEAIIYVAIRPVTAALQYTATDGTKNYTKTATSREYEPGNFYNLGLRMTEQIPAPSYTMAAAATSADKGKLIGTDGKIYADVAAATAAGTTAVAKIIYIGTTGHGTYSHGLALALTDEASTMLWQAAIDACSAKNTSTPVTDATWLLASKDQWDYMLGTNGAGSYTALRDGFSGISGASSLQSAPYWSSTEKDSDNAWYNYFGNGSWYDTGLKGHDSFWVRACLAF